jgi:hypothetical protein
LVFDVLVDSLRSCAFATAGDAWWPASVFVPDIASARYAGLSKLVRGGPAVKQAGLFVLLLVVLLVAAGLWFAGTDPARQIPHVCSPPIGDVGPQQTPCRQ